MKEEFPILKSGYVYLDSAASAQKPKAVLDALHAFYTTAYSNVHRGLHEWAEYTTIQYENARQIVADYLQVSPEETIFTSGATDSMNLLAKAMTVTENDTVITSIVDHHATFVPWQQAAKKVGASFKVIPVNQDGTLNYDQAEEIIKQGCSVLAITALSNVTGEQININRLAKLVHQQGGVIVVDGAQDAVHNTPDTKEVDAYVFSGHKLYGPTGIGVACIKQDLLKTLKPYRTGGEMIDQVGIENTTFQSGNKRFEAGTPPIAQAVGLGAAIKWKQSHDHEEPISYLYEELAKLDFISIIGGSKRQALVSFTVDGVHPHDVAQFLSEKGIAIRAGHHCTQPLHDALNIPASCRASLGIYNNTEDIDKLIEALKECKEAFDV